MVQKIQSPAVFSAKKAIQKAYEIHQFMQDKIAGQQIQSIKNTQLAQQKKEEQIKFKEKKMVEEKKLAQQKAKEKEQEITNSLISSAY